MWVNINILAMTWAFSVSISLNARTLYFNVWYQSCFGTVWVVCTQMIQSGFCETVDINFEVNSSITLNL